ncbi:MAG: hypothetical protein GF419_08845 [Ignavibacteriales bacterium]|nr:hypothetical protein [Ignavibacteriales bacterium]
MTKYIILLIAALLIADVSAQTSIVYRNYVEDSFGELLHDVPPEAGFMIWLNDDTSRVLFENAARWDVDPEPAIPGNGAYNVEIGNFMHPSPQVGDVVNTRFVARSSGYHLEHSETISMIPWIRPPQTLRAAQISAPNRPTGVDLALSGSDAVITWTTVPGVSYDVYGRYVDSLTPSNTPRMLYHRLATDLTSGAYTHVGSVAGGGTGYVVLPKKNGVFGVRSEEVVNYPGAPYYVAANVSSVSPYKVAVTWEADDRVAKYYVFRGDSATFVADATSLIAETTHPTAYIDEGVSEGETIYYRVRPENELGLKGDVSKAVSCAVEQRFEGKPDLNVLFISRHPKYDRYQIEYESGGYNPFIKPGTENVKHYPDDGETMTYIAHVKNTGGATVDSFKIEWFVDSVLQRTERYGAFYPEQRTTTRLFLPWSSEEPSYIRCEATAITPAPVEELTLLNNHIENRTNALGFDFHVEIPMAELYNTWKNKLGSYVIEDWLQFHMITFHRYFAEAAYPALPGGVTERVFIDSVSFNKRGAYGGGSGCPDNLWTDGRWGFGYNLEWFNIISVEHEEKGFDPGMMHELGHQLGLVDLYAQDIHGTTFASDFVEPRTGEFPDLTPAANFDNPAYYYNSRSPYGMMHSHMTLQLSDHSAYGLQRNLSKRRGWYGDYTFDFADDYAYRVTKPDGSPVAGYDITIWQREGTIGSTPKFLGKTNPDGVWIFPHQTAEVYEGGIGVANPFSTRESKFPQVVGHNATLFIRVAKGDSVGYAFHDICDFNVAYWEGDTVYAELPLVVEQWRIIPATNVERDEDDPLLPREYRLWNAYPNPFNPEARIKYDLKEASRVELAVFNSIGERVAVLEEGEQAAGYYERTFRPEGASGVYFYRLTVSSTESNETFTKTRKMVYIK